MAQEYDKYEIVSYSQYPTDDNKYECRTGPFEGFFVSSVEFCKYIKFDDKKDNEKIKIIMNRNSRSTRSTGQGPQAQGPPGANGTNGQDGAQGPPGPQGPTRI